MASIDDVYAYLTNTITPMISEMKTELTGVKNKTNEINASLGSFNNSALSLLKHNAAELQRLHGLIGVGREI